MRGAIATQCEVVGTVAEEFDHSARKFLHQMDATVLLCADGKPLLSVSLGFGGWVWVLVIQERSYESLRRRFRCTIRRSEGIRQMRVTDLPAKP